MTAVTGEFFRRETRRHRSPTAPLFWHAGRVNAPAEPTWLTVPDLVERLGVGPGRIHRLFEDRALLAIRRNGVLQVTDLFLMEGAPLSELRGTLIVLADSGYSDEEAMSWLLEEDEMLGTAPIDALRAGRKAEVRRVAQTLGF